MQREILKDLLKVVKGITPPDLVVRNGRLINVFTNSVEEGLLVVIRHGFIASVEEDRGNTPYGDVPVIDAEGLYLSPGFIDAHTHLDSMHPFYSFVPYALRGGTTTVVTETSAVACAAGIDGVETFVESTKGYPLRCYFLAPPLTPPFPAMEGSMGLSMREFTRLLKRDDFIAIGEAYWTRIVEGDDRVLRQAELALSLNKKLDGHSAGARGKRLTEYLLTGITSCHESVSMEEAVEKLRAGLYIMIREGFVRKELPELSKLKDHDADKRRVMLVSDVFDAVMLRDEGYLDSIVRKAVQYGFSPMEAIKMVTINPADYYGLRYLGALAPLRHADILFLEDMEHAVVKKVMVNGEVVFGDGKFLKTVIPYRYPQRVKQTVNAGHCSEEDFRIKADPAHPEIRIIEIVNQTITREGRYRPPIRDGYLEKDISGDIIPVAVINRRNAAQRGRSFVKGSGIREGALATTLTWDTGNILVIGSSEKDMAQAVNRLIDLQGGIVIARNNEIIYEFPMPAYGIMPIDSIENIYGKIRELEARLRDIGTSLERPFLTIQTIPFTGLPFLRITDKGLADIRNKKLVPLFL